MVKPHKYHHFIQLADDQTALVMDNELQQGTYYKITEDITNTDGSIVLKLQPIPEAEKLTYEVAQALAKQLETSNPELILDILSDALSESSLEKLKTLHQQVTETKVPIKVRKGCLELIVGKGRRWDNTIRIR